MKTKYKKEYVIERSKWVCGGDDVNGLFKNLGYNQLLNNKDRMCCLGQMCHSHGVPKKALRHEYVPLASTHKRVPAWMIGKYSLFDPVEKLIDINDDESLSQPEREKQIKAICKKIGIKVTFTGCLGGKRRKD